MTVTSKTRDLGDERYTCEHVDFAGRWCHERTHTAKGLRIRQGQQRLGLTQAPYCNYHDAVQSHKSDRFPQSRKFRTYDVVDSGTKIHCKGNSSYWRGNRTSQAETPNLDYINNSINLHKICNQVRFHSARKIQCNAEYMSVSLNNPRIQTSKHVAENQCGHQEYNMTAA